MSLKRLVLIFCAVIGFQRAYSDVQSRDISRAAEKLDAQTKKTILNLHGQGVRKEDIAQRIAYAVKDKARAQKIVDSVTNSAQKNPDKARRDEAMKNKRKEQKKQQLIKKQERENKKLRQKLRNEL